jgi:hypothetical protein
MRRRGVTCFPLAFVQVCCKGGYISTSTKTVNGVNVLAQCTCSGGSTTVGDDGDDDDFGDDGDDDDFGDDGDDDDFGDDGDDDFFGLGGDDDFLDGLDTATDMMIQSLLQGMGYSVSQLEDLGINMATLASKAAQGQLALTQYLTAALSGLDDGVSVRADDDDTDDFPCVQTCQKCCTCPGWYVASLASQDADDDAWNSYNNNDDFSKNYSDALKTGANVAAGIVVAIVIVVILAIGGCIACCVCMSRSNGNNNNHQHLNHPAMPPQPLVQSNNAAREPFHPHFARFSLFICSGMLSDRAIAPCGCFAATWHNPLGGSK